MPRTNKIHQAPDCTWVTLQKVGQSYRLSISGTLFTDNSRRYISLLSCRHDQAGLRKAHTYQMQVQDEIINGTFDSTLQKYESWKNRAIYSPMQKLTLLSLWEWWASVKKALISESTYVSKYAGVYGNSIKKIGDKTLNIQCADEVLSYAQKNINRKDAAQFINELTKACDRAIALGLMGGLNPFIGYSEKLAAVASKAVNTESVSELMNKNNGKVAYTKQERDNIIEWFILNESHYAFYIYFKFFTGCRFGESIELRWSDVSEDCKTIFFRRAYVELTNTIKPTKTNQERRFNCDESMTSLLLKMKGKQKELVFTSKYGARVSGYNITKRWERALAHLFLGDKITIKLSQNHTRHTFNQIARENNDKLDVAAQLGHSAQVADSHYTNKGDNAKILKM